MSEIITYVGIDAHKRELHVARLIGAATGPVTWTVANEPKAIDRLHRKLEREAPGAVRVCYEAGPCGYALQRQLTKGAVACVVIAPALMPRKPGDRVKTDRRDARKLAELFRAGLLTEVRPPTPAMMRVKTCSARATDLVSCCFVGACTSPGARTGRRRIGGGSRRSNGSMRRNARSSMTTCWPLTKSKADSGNSMLDWWRRPRASRTASPSRGCAVSAASTR